MFWQINAQNENIFAWNSEETFIEVVYRIEQKSYFFLLKRIHK